jgi:non-ribosomal peptide synthetase component F
VLCCLQAAGGCYVPLDPSIPDARLQGYVEDAGVALVLASRALADRAKDITSQVSLLRGSLSAPAVLLIEDVLSQPAVSIPQPPPPRPDDLAYIIFTSGSTGRPKGVCIAHRSLSDLCAKWYEQSHVQQSYHPNGITILNLASISFDVSVQTLLSPMGLGFRVVLPRLEDWLDSAYISHLITDHCVTYTNSTPSVAAALLENIHLDARSCRMQVWGCGGEALPVALVHLIRSRLPGVEVVNTFGPTEATVTITSWLSKVRLHFLCLCLPHADAPEQGKYDCQAIPLSLRDRAFKAHASPLGRQMSMCMYTWWTRGCSW